MLTQLQNEMYCLHHAVFKFQVNISVKDIIK